jgi:hypothetical protein
MAGYLWSDYGMRKKIEKMLMAKDLRIIGAEDEIDYLKRAIKLMDMALIEIASLPTTGGALARESIKKIREELGLCEPS